VVPSNAIIQMPAPIRYYYKNKRAVFANVETGNRHANVVELVSGVNPGDTIVVSGVLFVRPNALVKIRNN